MAGIDRAKRALSHPPRTPREPVRTETRAVHPAALPSVHLDGFTAPHLHLPNLHLPDLGHAVRDVASWFHLPFPGKGDAKNIGWIQKVKPGTTDVTDRFEKLDAAAKAGQNVLPPDAKNYVYLSVEGLFGQAVPTYFDANMDALKKAGLETGKVPVNTADGVEHNAQVVRDTVMKYAKEGKQVVLIGHSMGGLDASAALALYPELKDPVRALVTLQSPYGGSPMAHDFLEVPGLKAIGGEVLEDVFGGDVKCATDLTYAARQKFLAAHPMPAGVPTVCMASTRLSPLSSLFGTAEYMKARYGLDTDGLVSPKDAFIPGSQTVTLHGLDHADAVVDPLNPFLPYKPGDLTLSMLALALQAPGLPAQAPFSVPAVA